MAETLSREEVVALLLAGGIQGSTGAIEAQEGYYNYDTGSFIPFMSDQWQGVALPATNAYGTTVNVYGSPTSPYFLCKPGTAYTSSGEEIGGYSLTFEWNAKSDPEYPSVFHDVWRLHYYVFNTAGQVVGYSVGEADVPDPLPYDNSVYITPLAGYNDNSGSWHFDYYMGYNQKSGVEIKMKSFGSSFPGGQPLVDACGYWGAGQQPIIDDGVTPTGGSGGGGGSYSRPDETIGIPGLPSINLADLGLCTIYHVTAAQCAAFSAYLWTPGGFIDTVLKNAQAPMENIISLSMVPAISFNEGGAEILIGNAASGVQAYKLMTTFYELDFGSIYVNEYYRTFADYRTELQIYLPFIGIRDVPINDCMNGYIKVVYHVDVFSGQCVAFIQTQAAKGAWHVVASYNGSIACQVPLSGANYMGVFNGVLGAVGSAAGGNLIGAAGSLMNAAPSYMRSGNIGSTAGLMGIRYPYLIFTTPQQFTPATFVHNVGYISNVQGTLSSFSGFLQVDTSKLDLSNSNLSLMDEEIDMLYQMLDQGIYV